MIPHELDPEFEPLPHDTSTDSFDLTYLKDRDSKPKRSIKSTTSLAVGGLTAGYALSAIVVWALSQYGVDATPIEGELGFLLSAVGAATGGWSAPPTKPID